jgi:DnaA family protein
MQDPSYRVSDEQLVFELAPPGPPAFANFVAGPNEEALAALARMARAEIADTSVVLWGAHGSGKSHLLRATAAAAAAQGRSARYCAGPGGLDAGAVVPGALIAIDDIDAADPAAQGALFTLHNALAANGGQLLAAAGVPPARLALRPDLRTRLGQGLIFELRPLADADKAAALSAYAHERGFRLSNRVIAYLLERGNRDMPALVATLAELDRRSLSSRRPITVPLLREWLRRPGGQSGGAE